MDLDQLPEESHLRFSTDARRGYSRKIRGDAFAYFDTNGKEIADQAVITRINKLAIPPAWKEVWICPDSHGHLQATGLDSKGRKQYRYHPAWIELSQEKKFEHMLRFVQVLPKIRSHIARVLEKKELTREKILATVVWLLEHTLIRVGNEEYREENKSYGLTTLTDRQVDVSRGEVHFVFKGKSGVYHDVHVKSRRVARVIKYCQELPGQDLFEYKDTDGSIRKITSEDVNAYLKEISGEEITAKDFRTWAGTLLTARLLDRLEKPETTTATKKAITQIVKKVALHLRNRPATCRKYYIHPSVMDAFTRGYTLSNLETYKDYKKTELPKDLTETEHKILGLLSCFGESGNGKK